ncbi:MAG: DM13 domain-containing protein [Candidatus Limnocylindria bacterium]
MTFIGDLERFFAEFIFPYRVPVGVGLALALTAVAVLAWRRRWDRPLLRHPVGTMAVAVPMLLVIGSAAWFLGSPLVIRTELVEAGAMTSGLLSGEFQGADDFHFGEGRAVIVEQPDGMLVLSFEEFSVLNGPDLHVYVSPSPDGYATGAIDLGKLKATDGSFSYELPTGTELSSLASVVIWCEPFAVQFAHAELEAP